MKSYFKLYISPLSLCLTSAKGPGPQSDFKRPIQHRDMAAWLPMRHWGGKKRLNLRTAVSLLRESRGFLSLVLIGPSERLQRKSKLILPSDRLICPVLTSFSSYLSHSCTLKGTCLFQNVLSRIKVEVEFVYDCLYQELLVKMKTKNSHKFCCLLL